jgi:hypothetical protein
MSPVERAPVYEDESGLMYWNSALRTVELEAKKYVSSAGYRAFLEKVLDLIKQRHASKLLADLTKLGPTDNQDMVWSETDWFPRCLKAGLKFTALVMPRSLVAHMAVDQMSQRTDLRAVTRRVFGDVDEARTWLSRC